MSKPANFFKSLTDIPVHYDRPPLAPYGSLGVEYDFHATVDFENLLEACFAEIWEVCPLGKGQVIISAGAFVDKPNSFHNSGQAFDLDGIHWEGKSFVCLNYPSDLRFYLGIEAVLRKHFNTVLDYNYNPGHHDHLHVDVGGVIEFRKSLKSKVFFLQAALSHVLEIPVKIDGDWGSETSGAIEQALQRLNISGDIEERSVWFEFLDSVIELAFGGVPAEEKSPSELLRDVYSVISHELAENPMRKKIETALTTFVSHPRLSVLLDEAVTTAGKKVVVSKKTVSGKVNWSASVDAAPEFYVGTEFTYDDQNTKGIFNYRGIKYNPADYRISYGFWADFIYPTAVVESAGGRFTCLNTWDRAYFTFGFMQFAAHVYDGDFARYFRALLALPEAPQYFPDLVLKDGFIHQKTASGGLVKLEKEDSETNPSPLMKYLNPTSTAVEKAEAEQSARFIHWTDNSAEARHLQVRVGVDTFRRIISSRVSTYGLDGMIDKVCLVIADIHHQGRGGVQAIKDALSAGANTEAKYKNLLKIGYPKWKDRIDPLRDTIAAMVQQGKLEKMKYSKAQNDFVPL